MKIQITCSIAGTVADGPMHGALAVGRDAVEVAVEVAVAVAEALGGAG
jgi:hypothetical protein